MNIINPPKSEVIPMNLRQKLRSVQYYLLTKENENDSSGSADQLLKTIHLGVLLYVSIIQNDFWVASISEQLLYKLKSCLQAESFDTDSMRPLRLWLLFLVGSLVLHPTEKLWPICFIVEAISQLSLVNWCDAKLVLESFAWAGKIQDKSGRDLWDEAMRMKSLS